MNDNELLRGCERLEENIGYVFRDRTLLREALTHSSFSNEHGGQKFLPCNERLEFLGDSVLSIIVSDYLFAAYPDFPEGELTRTRAELVCEKACYEYAGAIGLGSFLLLGKGEEKGGGRTRKSILADAYEALIAAVYLDAGSNDAAKQAVEHYLMPCVKSMIERLRREWLGADNKTLLQQIVQSEARDALLEYCVIKEEGPDHAKVFTIEVRIDSNPFGTGSGSTKLEAEQNAAAVALEKFGVHS